MPAISGLDLARGILIGQAYRVIRSSPVGPRRPIFVGDPAAASRISAMAVMPIAGPAMVPVAGAAVVPAVGPGAVPVTIAVVGPRPVPGAGHDHGGSHHDRRGTMTGGGTTTAGGGG